MSELTTTNGSFQSGSEKAMIEEVMSALISCSRISISLGLDHVSSRIYEAEFALEKILEERYSH